MRVGCHSLSGGTPGCGLELAHPLCRQGSRAELASTAAVAQPIATRVLVAPAMSPPRAMNAGWTLFELIDHAVRTRLM